MLNFFKTKTFKVGSLVVAFALALALTASAMTFSGPTLRQGSKGGEVAAMQTLVGATADGNFGPMTKAAVMAWQASNGLTADGIFGAMSMAKANGGSTVGSTGALCPNGMTLASNCMTAPGAAGTGALCPNGMTLASNCMTSSTTSTGVLTGGAGSATITELSTPSSSTKVGEGDMNTQVLGIEVEADNNSDLMVTSMKVSFLNSGSGSSKLNRYAKSVSIWYNGVKVGSADVSEFSENSGTYSKSISIANAIVKAGNNNKGKFYVAVDALANIDSGDTGSSNNTWTVTLNSTRYQDGAGAVLTDPTGSIANTAIFDTLASTNDVELKVNLATDTPVSATTKVSTTTDTNQVELMKFTIKAQGSEMVIDQIPVNFAVSNILNAVTTNVTLKIDGQTFNETVSSAASSATIDFNDLNLSLSKDETLTGTILADIKDIDTNFAEGGTMIASITSNMIAVIGSGTAAFDAEDSNGDQIVAGDRTGSAIGNTMTFRSTGVNTVMGTPSYGKTTDQNGVVTQLTFTVPVAVTSFGNTLYMGQAAQFAATATASNAFAVVFENSTTPTTPDVTSSASIAISTSNATIESNGYRLDDGSTKNFTLEVTLNTPGLLGAVTAGNYRVRLDEIRTFTEAALNTGTNSDLLPTSSFRTDYKYITS